MKDTNVYIVGSNSSIMIIECPKCKYKWKTRSKLLNVTCPNCMRKFPIKSVKREVKKNE